MRAIASVAGPAMNIAWNATSSAMLTQREEMTRSHEPKSNLPTRPASARSHPHGVRPSRIRRGKAGFLRSTTGSGS